MHHRIWVWILHLYARLASRLLISSNPPLLADFDSLFTTQSTKSDLVAPLIKETWTTIPPSVSTNAKLLLREYHHATTLSPLLARPQLGVNVPQPCKQQAPLSASPTHITPSRLHRHTRQSPTHPGPTPAPPTTQTFSASRRSMRGIQMRRPHTAKSSMRERPMRRSLACE